MSQQANNRGRNASLDDKKSRAAGRKNQSPERNAIKDAVGIGRSKQVSGAFGKEGRPNRRGSVASQGAGGGGGGPMPDKAAPIDVGTKRR